MTGMPEIQKPEKMKQSDQAGESRKERSHVRGMPEIQKPEKTGQSDQAGESRKGRYHVTWRPGNGVCGKR